ncbi:MAG: class I SAM-dependent methyltransferase, partial [Thermoplasmata archaeon]|nr:class I SAM-dependent methyltransferase [Thermoplasmata archaeon]
AIERELPEINHVIDVGCGDLRIWGDRACKDYIGIDFSLKQLQENKERRRHWIFLCTDAAQFIPNLTRKNVFCFNTIYHILDPKKLAKVLINLCRYAIEKIFIYTWITNPFHPNTSDGEYQTYHPMGRNIELFRQNGFDLVSVEIPDPLDYEHLALYIYEKQKETPVERFPASI